MRNGVVRWSVLLLVVCMLIGTSGYWVLSSPVGEGSDDTPIDDDIVGIFYQAPPMVPDDGDDWRPTWPNSGMPTREANVGPVYELPFRPDMIAYYNQWNGHRSSKGVPSPPIPFWKDPSVLQPNDVLYMDEVARCIDLTYEQQAFLAENYMVGSSDTPQDLWYFSDAYELLLEGYTLPTFITSDSVVDALHLMFEDILIDLEETMLTEQAVILSRRMMELSDLQYDALPEGWRNLAAENVAFFGAALRLLDPEADVPLYAEEDVATICELIETAEGMHLVPGFDHIEDFTQYKPRGHYTQSEELERYFRAIMWYGRITFRGDNLHATQRAVLASLALSIDAVARDSYHYLTSAIDYLVGPPDDLTCLEYAMAVNEVIGRVDADYNQVFDADLIGKLQEYLKDFRPPRIQSGICFPEKPEWGLRIVGQRTVPDSYIFTQCTFDRLPRRLMPTVLDVMAVLGTDEAWGREDFETYPELEGRLDELMTEMDALPECTYESTAYWGWLHSLQALHEEVEAEDLPVFMGTEAWEAKQLNTQAASWTQLTHDTVLYRKQSSSCGPTSAPSRSWFVYVEPVPELYSRVNDLVVNMRDRLSDLSLCSEGTAKKIDNFSNLLSRLQRVAEAELEGTQPDQYDARSLRGYHNRLESLYSEKPKTVVVSDVHTDPNTMTCLQEGIGTLKFIVVIVPYEDGHIATVGVVFEHHEFVRSLGEGRLTDEEWKAMLEEGTAPEPAPWAQEFIL